MENDKTKCIKHFFRAKINENRSKILHDFIESNRLTGKPFNKELANLLHNNNEGHFKYDANLSLEQLIENYIYTENVLRRLKGKKLYHGFRMRNFKNLKPKWKN